MEQGAWSQSTFEKQGAWSRSTFTKQGAWSTELGAGLWELGAWSGEPFLEAIEPEELGARVELQYMY
jgi:hypothetical protein